VQPQTRATGLECSRRLRVGGAGLPSADDIVLVRGLGGRLLATGLWQPRLPWPRRPPRRPSLPLNGKQSSGSAAPIPPALPALPARSPHLGDTAEPPPPPPGQATARRIHAEGTPRDVCNRACRTSRFRKANRAPQVGHANRRCRSWTARTCLFLLRRAGGGGGGGGGGIKGARGRRTRTI